MRDAGKGKGGNTAACITSNIHNLTSHKSGNS